MLEDQGAIIRSGMAIVPDYAEQEARRQLMQLQKRRLDAEIAEQERQAQAEAAFQTDMHDVMLNPTAETYAKLILRHPKFAEKTKAAWGMIDAARQQGDLTQMGEIYSAAANGRYDLAAQSLKRRIEADRAADGQSDPHDEALLAAMESGDPVQQKAAMGMMGLQLSAITGPDKFSSTLGTLTEGSDGFTLSPGSKRYDAEGNLVAEAPFAPRIITLEDGKTYIEHTPGQYTPTQGGGGPASGGGGGGTPRGVRNNNVGNLKDGPFAKSQPGYKGADPDGFAIFETPAQGQGAQVTLLRNKYLKNGLNTVDGIIEKYAPASENSPEARANYKAHVAAKLGVGLNDPIPPEAAPQLASAMAEFENGSGGGQAGGPHVIAKGAPKTKEPSVTRVLNGKTYYKIDGRWFDNPEGV